MTAPVLMVQGTASSVGKSMLVTALCRILRDEGLRVAPFKAQNMSNNSYVTVDGGELGRAQVSQAEAAGVEPLTDMNPILLKPESDRRSQIVLNGRPFRSAAAREYFQLKQTLWPHVTGALDRLRSQFDAVIIEGAGSPAEINLRAGDIVNMRVACYAQAPVLLVGDIDRGGVFAHLIGTLELLEPAERSLVRGLVINKFRGDPELLRPGLTMLEERTGIPVAGVVPYMPDVGIADEDAVALDDRTERAGGEIEIAVVRLPHISNFDDFDPLEREPGITIRYVTSPAELKGADLIVIPGTKSTVADLDWMRRTGLARALVSARESSISIIGVCGGFQMLGTQIDDPELVESAQSSSQGLGLLHIITRFDPEKTTQRIKATVSFDAGLLAGAFGDEISGYEIHMGGTSVAEAGAFRLTERLGTECDAMDGAVSADGWVLGTYLHGLFDNDHLRQTILQNIAARKGITRSSTNSIVDRDRAYTRLAETVRASLDMQLVHALLQQSGEPNISPAGKASWAH